MTDEPLLSDFSEKNFGSLVKALISINDELIRYHSPLEIAANIIIQSVNWCRQ